MFVIKKYQLSALHNKKVIELVTLMSKKIKNKYQYVYADDDLSDKIRFICQEATYYKICHVNDVRTYVELHFKYPSEFTQPLSNWMKEILTWPNRSGYDKIFLIRKEFYKKYNQLNVESNG